jgi:hypothetical protein
VKDQAKAIALFKIGLDKARKFDRDMKQLRRDGIDAAFSFMAARELVAQGEWGLFCEVHAENISPRQIRFWCQLGEEAIAWVRSSNPKLNTVSEIQAAARDLVMQSPKPLIALCRELGHMRKFGEYDAIRYATKKLGGGTAQIEFKFDELLAPLDHLAHFGEDKFTFTYPAGRDEAEVLDEAITKTRAVLERLEHVKKHGRIIEA